MPIERPAGGFIRPYEAQLGVLSHVFDIFLVTLSLWLSLSLYSYPWQPRYTILAVIAAALFYVSAEIFGVYRAARTDSLRRDLRHVAAAWLSVAIVTLFLGYATKVTQEYSRLAIGTWFLLTPALIGASRGFVRIGLSVMRRHGLNTRNVAIVGAGPEGIRLAETLIAAPWIGFRVIGIFDDRQPAPDRISEHLPRPLMGTTRDLLEKAKSGKLDIVYVTALPISDKERIIALVNALSNTTVSVYIVPDMFLFSMFHGKWVQVGQVPAVSVFETPFYGIDGWLKRCEDIVIASLVLLLMALPMSLIAVAIKLTSSGPVIFKQRRYGLDGKVFHIWKFRTMTVREDHSEALKQAQRNDSRVTRLGGFLRRSSLDELPQFFNVLAGTMSVVGPRPHATAHNERYRKMIQGYMVRHKVRPGITGWAQANGWRGETDTLDKMEARVEHDLWYIRNWSVLLDLKIIIHTALRGWRSVNAY
jgi:putative colanic acid biosynthesis UDP-glucose lipid carrier transferase